MIHKCRGYQKMEYQRMKQNTSALVFFVQLDILHILLFEIYGIFMLKLHRFDSLFNMLHKTYSVRTKMAILFFDGFWKAAYSSSDWFLFICWSMNKNHLFVVDRISYHTCAKIRIIIPLLPIYVYIHSCISIP